MLELLLGGKLTLSHKKFFTEVLLMKMEILTSDISTNQMIAMIKTSLSLSTNQDFIKIVDTSVY